MRDIDLLWSVSFLLPRSPPYTSVCSCYPPLPFFHSPSLPEPHVMNEDYEIRVSFLIQNTSHLFYPVLWFEVILGYFAAISMTL